jgi:hypothetical protein
LVTKIIRELKTEQRELELAMTPFLQSEMDISFTVHKRAFLKKVEELMKDDPTFNVYEHFYHNKDKFDYPMHSLDLSQFRGTGLLEDEEATI